MGPKRQPGKGSISKRQKIEPKFLSAPLIEFQPESIPIFIWLDQIIPQLSPKKILQLASVSKFFAELLSKQSTQLWIRLCKINGFDVYQALSANIKDVFISHAWNACFICHNKRSSYSELVDVFVCRNCYGEPPFETISPTMAKKVYHINNDAFVGLRYITYTSRAYGRRGQQCQLYLVSEVKQRAYEIYGSKEEWKRADKRSKQRKTKLAKTKAKREEEKTRQKEELEAKRKAILVSALAKKNIQFREDSTLCEAYIEGSTNRSLKEIVEIMFKMKILYTETNYEAEWDDYYEAHFAHIHRDEFDWYDDFRDLKWEIREARENMQDRMFHEWKLAHPQRYQEFLDL